MLADGICYPTEFWPELQIFAHHELLKELSQIPNPKLEQVFSTLNASGHRKILLSCEGFIGVSRERLEYLRSLIRASEVRSCSSRDDEDWIPSQWQQTVKQGAVESLAEMYAKTLATAAGDQGSITTLFLTSSRTYSDPTASRLCPIAASSTRRRTSSTASPGTFWNGVQTFVVTMNWSTPQWGLNSRS